MEDDGPNGFRIAIIRNLSEIIQDINMNVSEIDIFRKVQRMFLLD